MNILSEIVIYILKGSVKVCNLSSDKIAILTLCEKSAGNDDFILGAEYQYGPSVKKAS